ILGQRRADDPNLKGLETVIAEVFTPVLVAAGDGHIAVRALDLIEEEAAEHLDVPRVLADMPRLGVPLGVPELLRVQTAGPAPAAGACSPAIPAGVSTTPWPAWCCVSSRPG